MFCLQHLKRNVWHKFPALKEPPMNQQVKTLLEKAARAQTSSKFLDSFCDFLSVVISNEGSTTAMNVAQHLLSIDPSHWTIMANNKRMFCSEIHSKCVNQLFRHLTAAVKLEQHLMPENNDNGLILDIDDMQLAQKFSRLRVTQLKMHPVSLDLCSKISGNVLAVVKTKTMWPKAWAACAFAVVFVKGPPQTPLFCSFKTTTR